MGLFKTTNHFHETRTAAPYPQTIHEHRAPTDESVKVLREMEEAARESVMAVYEFKNNDLSGIVILRKWDPAVFGKVAYIRFALNGKKYEMEEEIDDSKWAFDRRNAIECFISKVRDAILQQLIPHIGEFLENETKTT